jgi:peptidoglycan/xylan/chitin deacetylase (PgdA/CDA1 family)
MVLRSARVVEGRGRKASVISHRVAVALALTLVSACVPPRLVSPSAATASNSPPTSAMPTPTGSPSSPIAVVPAPSAPCQPGCLAPAPYERHGSRLNKVVALTFDDGFNVPACISIVDTLLAQGVTATFFPNGQYVRETPSFWHWVAGHGFPVGNHTTTHNDPRALAASALEQSLGSDRRIADAALGVPSINAYRPPYGDYDLPVQEIAAVAGYPVLVGWDVDSRDQNGVASVAAEVANATTGINGSIVLMHCGSRLTPLALPLIVASYRARGFSFVSIPELLGLPAPTTAWVAPASPDLWPVTELSPTDSQASWNASPAVDRMGHLHVADETPTGIEYSDDTTGAWQSERVATTTDTTFASRPSIALDPTGGVDLVYLVLTIAGTELEYQHRTHAGVWSSPTIVATLTAPASTATIAIDPGGQPVIAYATLTGRLQGISLARLTSTGWSHTHVPTTNGSFLNPSIAIDAQGAILLVERRNGHPELDETTNASGTWTTTRLWSIPGSAVPFVAFDPAGRLVVAAQETYSGALMLGIRPPGGPISWSTVTQAGDLSGLAIAPGGDPLVAFSRTAAQSGTSRLWLAGRTTGARTGQAPQ